MKKFPLLEKYSHAWVFLYFLIYMPWFIWLEGRTGIRYHFVRSALDSHIPFCKYFVVPYLFWFGFVAVTVIYFFFHDKLGFKKLMAFLIAGMTSFLVISTLYPTALNLRPPVVGGDDIFAQLVRFIYQTDTSTNVFPSIHVYNSLGCMIAIMDSQELCRRKSVVFVTYALTITIILSTMFLKQHSIIDVTGAFLMALAFYSVVYMHEARKSPALRHQIG